MSAFENVEIAFVRPPTPAEVLERLRRDAPCRGDPRSANCTLAGAEDRYLLEDRPAIEVCQDCPEFGALHRKLEADWQDWVVRLQEAYS